MHLSEGERLILVMLCDIHKALKIKGAIDPDALTASVLNGDSGGLGAVVSEVAGLCASAEGVAGEVDQILAMWAAIERGYKRLTVDEKREVEAGAGPLGRGVRFSGFDAESENRHREAAQSLIEQTEKFERFQGRNLDAHMPCLAGYRRMLRAYGLMRGSDPDPRLGVEQIIVLANAEKYAD